MAVQDLAVAWTFRPVCAFQGASLHPAVCVSRWRSVIDAWATRHAAGHESLAWSLLTAAAAARATIPYPMVRRLRASHGMVLPV